MQQFSVAGKQPGQYANEPASLFLENFVYKNKHTLNMTQEL